MPSISTPLADGYSILGSITATRNRSNIRINQPRNGITEDSRVIWDDGTGLKTKDDQGNLVDTQTYTLWTLDLNRVNHLDLFNSFVSISVNAIAPKVPNIEQLNLFNCSVSENISLAISSLTKLKFIDLGFTGATLDNFDLFKNFPDLAILNIPSCDITDDVVNLPRSFEQLYLRDSTISGTTGDLPDCLIYNLEYTSITGKILDISTTPQDVRAINLRASSGIDKDWTGLNNYSSLFRLEFREWNMSESEVDGLLQYLYTNRASFTASSKRLNLLSNAMPSGTDGDLEASGTGYGFITGLRNDGWTIFLN